MSIDRQKFQSSPILRPAQSHHVPTRLRTTASRPPKNFWRSVLSRKWVILPTGVMLLLLIGLAVAMAIKPARTAIVSSVHGGSLQISKAHSTSADLQGGNGSKMVKQTPARGSSSSVLDSKGKLIPLVPSDEPQLATSGTYQTGNVYVFSDLYMGTPLQISERALPAGAPADKFMQSLASALQATQPVPLKDALAYMSPQSSEGSVQSVLYIKSGVVILLRTTYQHSASEWSGYLVSLKRMS